jgi:hypothetical protein
MPTLAAEPTEDPNIIPAVVGLTLLGTLLSISSLNSRGLVILLMAYLTVCPRPYV